MDDFYGTLTPTSKFEDLLAKLLCISPDEEHLKQRWGVVGVYKITEEINKINNSKNLCIIIKIKQNN
jgi:hypothetical protein